MYGAVVACEWVSREIKRDAVEFFGETIVAKQSSKIHTAVGVIGSETRFYSFCRGFLGELMRRPRRMRTVLVLFAVILPLALLAVAWDVGGKLVAPHRNVVGAVPEGLSGKKVTFVSDDRLKVHGWHLPTPDSKGTVILLHPIRTDRRAMLGRAAMLNKAGYTTLLIDLPSHGESDGNAITAGWRERHAVSAAVHYVRLQNREEKVAIVGWSLGGAAALFSSPLDVDALVLEAVYPSVTEAIHNRIELRLGGLHHVVAPLLLYQFYPRLGVSAGELTPIDHIAAVKAPVLIMAGDLDSHTTLAESRSLYAAASEPKKFHLFEGASHQDFYRYDREGYEAAVLAFLANHLD